MRRLVPGLRRGTTVGGLTLVMIGLAAGVALALLVNSQVASAELSMATSSDFELYICEPGGGPGEGERVEGPECPTIFASSDDSGAGELIFEADEDAAPGSERIWDIRLINRNADGTPTSVAWDLWSFNPVFTPLNIQAETCPAPTLMDRLGVRILGIYKPDDVIIGDGSIDGLTGVHYWPNNDNHVGGGGSVADAIDLASEFDPSPSYIFRVHVEPGEYEDLRLHVFFPDEGQGDECAGAEWSLVIDWNVAAHS